jgi:hypothetical protein
MTQSPMKVVDGSEAFVVVRRRRRRHHVKCRRVGCRYLSIRHQSRDVRMTGRSCHVRVREVRRSPAIYQGSRIVCGKILQVQNHRLAISKFQPFPDNPSLTPHLLHSRPPPPNSPHLHAHKDDHAIRKTRQRTLED